MSAKSKGQTNSRNSGDQADELKRRARRRLVGSIVLFLTAIIVVPAIIETEPVQTQSPIELVVPDRPEPEDIKPAPPVSASVPTDTEIAQNEPEKQAPAPVTEPEPPKTKPEDKPVVPAPKPEAEPKPKPEVKKTEPEPPKPIEVEPSPVPEPPIASDPIEKFAQADVYWVQVVAVKDKARAETLRQKLSESGFEGRIESVSTDKGPVYRVRVGPLAGQNRANEIKQQLKVAGYEGRIVQ